MRRTTIILAFLLAPAGMHPAVAATDCTRAATQTELNACVGDDLGRADATLNALYQTLMKRISGDDRTRLRDAQRAWVAFRDKHCAFIGGPSAGGSMQPMVIAGCMAELTAERSGQFLQQLHCEEGDPACVR